jgi:hypothetical protein
VNPKGFVAEATTLERFVIGNSENLLHEGRITLARGSATFFFKIFTPLGVIVLDARSPGVALDIKIPRSTRSGVDSLSSVSSSR